jgi:hypothetical protein
MEVLFVRAGQAPLVAPYGPQEEGGRAAAAINRPGRAKPLAQQAPVGKRGRGGTHVEEHAYWVAAADCVPVLCLVVCEGLGVPLRWAVGVGLRLP